MLQEVIHLKIYMIENLREFVIKKLCKSPGIVCRMGHFDV